jgi:hypothetical protein
MSIVILGFKIIISIKVIENYRVHKDLKSAINTDVNNKYVFY